MTALSAPWSPPRASAWTLMRVRWFGRRAEVMDIDHGVTTTLTSYLFRGALYITDIRTDPMLTPATTAQREKLLRLLRKAEYDTKSITPLYRRLGVPDSAQGQSVDAYLGSLNSLQASDLINKLEREVTA